MAYNAEFTRLLYAAKWLTIKFFKQSSIYCQLGFIKFSKLPSVKCTI